MDTLKLELHDPDAIFRDDGANADGMTRFDLLRRTAATGAGVIGGGLLLSRVPAAHAQATTDVDILNLLLLNEAMEVEFYSQAIARAGLRGRVLTFATQLRANEIVHRDTIAAALGSRARPIPPFDFGNTTASQDAFLSTSLALENNDVVANNGAGPLLRSKAILAAAGQIVSVEGRQAAWIRRIVYGPNYQSTRQYPAPVAFDVGISPAETRRRLAATGFVKGTV